jgi:hypothetical protein
MFMAIQEAPIPANSERKNGQVDSVHNSLVAELEGGKFKKYARFVIAALSSLPWVGGVIGAIGTIAAEVEQDKVNALHKLWVNEHREKIQLLGITFNEIFSRLDTFGEEVQNRIESDAYLALVRRTFRSWDQADTQEKRQMLKKLVTNAGAITLCPDDLIRLFINWIDMYHEAHFVVIKEIYQNPGITRGEVWDKIHGERPREDSAEADLFRYLIRELSTGGVIRQQRETDMEGNFIRQRTRPHPRGIASNTMESAFEDTKPYVLTELGKQFVHYVMEDVVPQIEGQRNV